MIKRSRGESIFNIFNVLMLLVLMIITLYPFLYVLLGSFSDPVLMSAHSGILFRPIGFSLSSYEAVLKNDDIFIGYRNTIFYVVVGTFINIVMTTLSAYVISRKNLYWKGVLIFIAVFTMYFSGGLVPKYLLVRWLGLTDTVWALLFPVALSTYNMIVLRTAFMLVPDSLQESAKLDGAGDFMILFRIMIPLSAPTIAVITLFYGVGHWNSWFSALIYLRNRQLYPLQIFLREILLFGSDMEMVDATSVTAIVMKETIKYATIIFATLPILCVYPFLQRFFVKGVMLGAIKG